MKESSVHVYVSTDLLLGMSVSVMGMAWGSMCMPMVVAVVVNVMIVVVAMVVVMIVSVVVVVIMTVVEVSFRIQEVFLQRWVIDLLLSLGLSRVIVAVAVIVSTAPTFAMSVVVLTSQMVVSLTRVQNLHLN